MTKIIIGHLYPDLLNLYGDCGNITALCRRLTWRGIEAQVCEYHIGDSIDFSNIDIVFLGGGSDREQMLVCQRLQEFRQEFKNYVENGGVVLAICGGYQLLGHYYQLNETTIQGLAILDITTENQPGRLIGNVIIQSSLCSMPVVGFENHGGRTFIGSHKPLGRADLGKGNNGQDGTEGVVYNNLIGTYLHGPILPKNPELCDWLLRAALVNKGLSPQLPDLDDRVEIDANEYVVNNL